MAERPLCTQLGSPKGDTSVREGKNLGSAKRVSGEYMTFSVLSEVRRKEGRKEGRKERGREGRQEGKREREKGGKEEENEEKR